MLAHFGEHFRFVLHHTDLMPYVGAETLQGCLKTGG